jgi:twitching motility protein PilT
MRHDPDIVLLGEMRELETIKLALGCASMGMLVFGTLHTNNAPKTVDRIINTVPGRRAESGAGDARRAASRASSPSCCASAFPRAAAPCTRSCSQHEALPNTIRSGQIANIKSIIESGGDDGMITMDNSLMNRVKDGTIEAKEAYMKAANKAAVRPAAETRRPRRRALSPAHFPAALQPRPWSRQ